MRRGYRAMLPVPTLLSALADGTASDPCATDVQEQIYGQVVNDPICARFPPSAAYRKRFLKALIDRIQEHDEEVYEPLLETYMELLQLREEREACYKTYSFTFGGEERTITIKIAQEFHVVGLAEWEAGFYLAEFILSNPELFEGKACLELGSGIGLTGLVLAAVGPKRVILTDYLEDPVLVNLRLNVQNSGYEVHALQDDGAGQTPPGICVNQLDWLDYTEEQLDRYLPDTIIAADVLYDPGLVDACLNVVSSLLRRNPRCVALIASTIRNEKTFAHFLSRSQQMGLTVSTVSLHSSPPSLASSLPFDLPSAPHSPPLSTATSSTDLPHTFPYARDNKVIVINSIRLAVE